MTTDRRSTPTSVEDRWLTATAAPGRRWLMLAGGCQTLETLFTVVQWAGLARVARDLLHHVRPGRPGLGLLLAGGLLAAGAAWAAARCQAIGRHRIAHSIRRGLVTALLPDAERRADPDPATAALATVELTDDIAQHHTEAVPRRLSAPASMLAILVVTAAAQWPVAVILLVATLLLPLNMRLAGVFAKEGADERQAASTRLAAVVLDSFRGMATLRNLGALAHRRAELAAAADELNASTMAVVRRAFLSGAVMDVVITFSIAANATYVGLGLLGYVHITAAPDLTLFRGLLALLLCPMYFQPLRAAAAGYHSKERALSAAAVISGLLADADADADAESEAGTEPAPARGRRGPLADPVTVVLDDVSFRFAGAAEQVLHGVDLTVRAGAWTAVTGPSGVGKTTLLSLVAGVRPPTGGTVRWLTDAGTSQPRLGGCAWIGQQTVLLPGSVGDNIRVGRPDAGRDDMMRAVAAAGLADVARGCRADSTHSWVRAAGACPPGRPDGSRSRVRS
jgi:ATP-binding cassette subfamily C protein CydD